MGRRIQVHLTNDELRQLEELCEKHNASQSQIIKVALLGFYTNPKKLQQMKMAELERRLEFIKNEFEKLKGIP